MSFPLCHRPGGIIFLDDDPDYLEMLADVVPNEWYVRLFLSPQSCIQILQKEPALWEQNTWRQQEIVSRWRAGQSLVGQVLEYWREDGSTRFNLTQVCVVDYSMPSMSGLRFLSEIVDWVGSRVMLTGRADAQLGVSAFNRGLIDRFIPKQSPAIRLRLLDTIDGLRNQPHSRHHHIWQSTLKPEHSAWLVMPPVDTGLTALAQKLKWIEHVVIGEPFGVLGLNAQGQVTWLQLTPASDLTEMATHAQAQGLSTEEATEIRAGRKLANTELAHALGWASAPQTAAATLLGIDNPQSPTPRLYAAAFSIDPAQGPSPEASYERFLAEVGQRELLN